MSEGGAVFEPEAYTVDPKRLEQERGTGVFVRALYNGKMGNFDICNLDRDSLLRWLRSRGGANEWAEQCVLILLGHK